MRAVDAVEGWFEARAPRKDPPNTVKAYRSDLASVLVALGAVLDCDPDDVDTDDLSLMVMRKAFGRWAADRAASSVRRGWSTWSGFFGYLVSEGLVPGSPMPGVGKPKAPRRQPRAFSRDDVERIVATVEEGIEGRRDPWPEMERAVVMTALLSGGRTAELLAADVGDVSLSPGSERVRLDGKTGVRAVPLPPMLLTLLGDYLRSRRARFPGHARQRGVAEDASPWEWWRPDAPLFVDRHGERLGRGALQYLVTLVYRQAGVDATRASGALVHALRHTKATRMAEAGATPVELMEFLGQASLSSTQGYVSATARDVRDAAMRDPTLAAYEDGSRAT